VGQRLFINVCMVDLSGNFLVHLCVFKTIHFQAIPSYSFFGVYENIRIFGVNLSDVVIESIVMEVNGRGNCAADSQYL